MRAKASNSSLIYAILSNTIVLVLIGFFSILYLHINSITSLVKEKINILVELKEDSTAIGAKEALMKMLTSNEKVVPGSVQFIPKSNAEKFLGIELQESVQKAENPFKDIIAFNVLAQHYNEKNLSKIKNELMSKPGVFFVFFENVVVENVKSNLQNVSLIVLVLSLIFIFLAVVIIFNTTNLSLYADRWEIKTMEIIGARDNFIRQPYLKMAGGIAIKSFVIAVLILFVFLALLVYKFDFFEIFKWYYLILACIFMFVISLAIATVSTVYNVNKYLSKKNHELY